MSKLIIELEDINDIEAVEVVLDQLKQGYTSGFNPNWYIEEGERS